MVGLKTSLSRRKSLAVSLPGLSLGQGVVQAGVVPPVPVYLPTAVAPYFAYGGKRLLDNYASGPIYRLRRSSDDAELDVSPTSAGDKVDIAAITAWAGSATVFYTAVYDQSGNGLHATQTVKANQPLWLASHALAGSIPLSFNSSVNATTVARFMDLPSMALNRNSFTTFMACEVMNSKTTMSYFEFINTAKTSAYFSAYQHTTASTGFAVNGNAARDSGRRVRCNPSVIGVSSGASNTRLYVQEQEISLGAQTAQAMNEGGFWGRSTSLLNSYRRSDDFAFIGYNVQLSTAQATAVRDSLISMFDIATTFDFRWVLEGDSIDEGADLVGAAYPNVDNLRGVIHRQVLPLLAKKPEVFNIAVSGRLLATAYSERATYLAPLYSSSMRTVYTFEECTNDIAANGATAGYASTLYSSTATPLISYTKGLGGNARASLQTCISRNSFPGNQKETERQSWNGLVTANSATADAVVDLTGIGNLNDANAYSNTAYFPEGIHLTVAGQALRAPVIAAAVGSMSN